MTDKNISQRQNLRPVRQRPTQTAWRTAMLLTCLLALVPLNELLALGVSEITGIEEIAVGTGDKPVFRVANPGEAGEGCANNVWIRFPDLAAYEGNRRIYNLIVAALMNHKPVRIQTLSCDGDYPLLHRVWVQ